MKNKLQLVAWIDNLQMLENMVEQLASRPNNNDHVTTVVPRSWEAMNSSSVESYISGTIDISGKHLLPAHIPFTSSFLFSCTKEKNNPYQIRWCNSLS